MGAVYDCGTTPLAEASCGPESVCVEVGAEGDDELGGVTYGTAVMGAALPASESVGAPPAK